MRRARGASAIAASPTLVGAVTTLIVIVAVFLSYNANQGLPFVPVYRVAVDVPNAARLVPNNEVRIGGNRVGMIESIEAAETDNGDTVARLNLALDRKVEPLPQNTAIRIRYQSAFGLKYLEMERGAVEGASSDPISEGGVIPIENHTEQVEFDDIYGIFDERTRIASRGNLDGYGRALTARGMSINRLIENLNPLFTYLRPVMRTLADPDTRLERFFQAAGRTSSTVAPVAERQAETFGYVADTFGAIAEDEEALAGTIRRSPVTQQAAIDSFRVQRPFLANFTELARELRPGVRELPATLPVMNSALRIGTPVLRRTPPMNRNLRLALAALERLVEEPATESSLRRLADGLEYADPLLDYVAPAQTVCNMISLAFHRLGEHLSKEDAYAHSQRVHFLTAPLGLLQKSPINAYSGVPSDGIHNLTGEFDPDELAIVHANAYGPVVNEDGTADCQTGQNGYILGQVLAPGQPADSPGVTVWDLPGSRGPNFFGRERRP